MWISQLFPRHQVDTLTSFIDTISTPNPHRRQRPAKDKTTMPPHPDDDPRSSKPRAHTSAGATHPQSQNHHNKPSPIDFELFDPHNLLTHQDHANINAWVHAVFAHLNASGSVRAKVVNDDQMSIAHQQFSGIPHTTDVLTFDLSDHPVTDPRLPEHSAPIILDTDVIICIDEAKRQAAALNHSPAHELLLYIIHGTLHCLGYNDHTTQDFNTMHTKEDELLTAAGIGPLFHRKPNP
ncbi:MAG: rRNA maturation RNase YbeY [Phycisphaerales bacterium]